MRVRRGWNPVELFQILKDDAVKLLHSICQQIWKTQQWPQDWKKSVFILFPKKGNAKERSNYCTIALISHASWKKSYDQPRQHIKKQRHYFANKGLSSQGYGFSSSHVWMWELDWRLSVEELMLLNYGVGEDSWESLGLQGDPTSPSYRKSVPNIHWKDWCWSGNSNTLATWCKELTHLKRPWCWERSKAGGEREDRGWDGWMVSLTQWTWVWVNSGSWWRTGKPGVLQSMGLQRVGHDWATEMNWTELNWCTHLWLHPVLVAALRIFGGHEGFSLVVAHRLSSPTRDLTRIPTLEGILLTTGLGRIERTPKWGTEATGTTLFSSLRDHCPCWLLSTVWNNIFSSFFSS